jgi:hypothetical protein
MLEAKPIELKDANIYVQMLHRHHPPVYRDKFRIAAFDGTKIVGVIQVARPVSRILDDGKTIEVVRLCTDGTKNACSFLYSRAARIAKEMGYDRIITYILENESGDSLKASGWKFGYLTKGHKWTCPSRPRKTLSPDCNKQLWKKDLKG